MFDNVYTKIILNHAANITHIGRLQHADATSQKHSRFCGSKITVDITMSAGVITDFAHQVQACLLGQASAALLAKYSIGSTGAEIKQLHTTIFAMLTDNGAPPTGKFAEFSCLVVAKNHKSRHASILLALDAALECIHSIETNLLHEINLLEYQNEKSILKKKS